MIFRVLGCSGSESDESHPCSFLIGDSVVLDMGSAASRLTFQEQAKITDLFLSHAHLDHVKDLAFFAANVFAAGSGPVTVRGTRDTLRKIRKHLLNNRIWPDFTAIPSKKQAVLRFEPFRPGKPVRVKDLEVLPLPVDHPGGCSAFFLKGGKGTILYSGDTGPTEKIWREAARRGKEIRAVLLDVSFPTRLALLAEESGHHTPASFAREIGKFGAPDVPVYAYHLKAPYQDEIARELATLDDPRVKLLKPGMEIDF